MKTPRAPTGLKTPGKKFWRKVLSEYQLEEAHDLERLFQACGCLDQINECEEIVKTEGRFVLDRFLQKKENPASKAVRDNKVLFCRILRELALDIAVPDSRIPRQY